MTGLPWFTLSLPRKLHYGRHPSIPSSRRCPTETNGYLPIENRFVLVLNIRLLLWWTYRRSRGGRRHHRYHVQVGALTMSVAIRRRGMLLLVVLVVLVLQPAWWQYDPVVLRGRSHHRDPHRPLMPSSSRRIRFCCVRLTARTPRVRRDACSYRTLPSYWTHLQTRNTIIKARNTVIPVNFQRFRRIYQLTVIF